MRSSSSHPETAGADQTGAVLSRSWLHEGELVVLEAACAVGRRIHVVGCRVLASVRPSTTCVAKTLVLLKLQFLLLELGDFLMRLGERRFLLAQRVFQSKQFLLHGKQLPLVSEKAVLGFEDFGVQLRHCRCHLVEVMNACRRLADVAGGADRGSRRAEK